MKTSTLISSVAIALSVSSFATAAATFGTLSYGSTPIAFNTGNINNENFWFSNTNIGTTENPSALTLGMKSIGYFGQNPNPEYMGNGTWEAQAGRNAGPIAGAGGPDAPTWNFIWSVTVDGARPSATDLYWSMLITGPDGTTFGTKDTGMVALSENFSGPNDPVYQNAWVCSYSFLSLGFDPNETGRYTFDLSVFQRAGSVDTQLSTLTMNVDVVPAPGAVALVGLAGLVGRRRRA